MAVIINVAKSCFIVNVIIKQSKVIIFFEKMVL